jgi:hypothetical protein
VESQASQAELLILVEGGDERAPETIHRLRINGKEVIPVRSSSYMSWGASGMKRPEQWTFFAAPLSKGENAIAFDLILVDPKAKLSMWAWATRPGSPGAAIQLPEPEKISLGAVPLLEPTQLMAAPGDAVKAPRPVEKIEGVFLDSFDPVSATQGYGTLQKNQSVWEKPMTIAGKNYRRGVGTHAPSRIVYDLGSGKYKRFQAWAGADYATSPTITFEVWVDGQKQWESGLMKRDDAAKRVDVDIANAKTLELVVGDGGNDLGADHADWADARLVK